MKEMEAIRNDPENYIYEYFGELTNQVDLRRETLIGEIKKYSDELIQKIEKHRQDCVAKSKKTTKVTEVLETIKSKMKELNSMFNSLEIDDKKLEEIMSKKKSNELNELMAPVLRQIKFELQGEKYHKFITEENIFGTLCCSDFDIDNIKVNIV